MQWLLNYSTVDEPLLPLIITFFSSKCSGDRNRKVLRSIIFKQAKVFAAYLILFGICFSVHPVGHCRSQSPLYTNCCSIWPWSFFSGYVGNSFNMKDLIGFFLVVRSTRVVFFCFSQPTLSM